jgi:hypothetical protein
MLSIVHQIVVVVIGVIFVAAMIAQVLYRFRE